MAMLRRLGCEVGDLGILRDEPTALADALRQAAQRHDLILTTGGVSTGEEDHVKASVERAGSLVLWRMAIKPRPAGRDGRHCRHSFHRLARQSGGELRHLCPCGASDHFGRCAAHKRRRCCRCRSGPPSTIGRRPVAANMSAPRCARRMMVRWRRSSFLAKARACCRRWSRPTAWSSWERTSSRSRPATVSGSSAMRHAAVALSDGRTGIDRKTVSVRSGRGASVLRTLELIPNLLATGMPTVRLLDNRRILAGFP